MSIKIECKIGDVFAIECSAGVGIGQVLQGTGEIYIVIFKDILKAVPIKIYVEDLDPMLHTWTLDGKLYRGEWKIIQNSKLYSRKYPQPEYKVGYDGEFWVESFLGQKLRPANKIEMAHLSYKTVRTPELLHQAFCAYKFFEGEDVERKSEYFQGISP